VALILNIEQPSPEGSLFRVRWRFIAAQAASDLGRGTIFDN
jgi:hypothetical protein